MLGAGEGELSLVGAATACLGPVEPFSVDAVPLSLARAGNVLVSIIVLVYVSVSNNVFFCTIGVKFASP